MTTAGLPAPEFKQIDFMLRATLRKMEDTIDRETKHNGQLNGQLNGSQQETLTFIESHEGCNIMMIAEGLNKPFRTIDKHIRVLVELHLIERRGSKKTGGYFVTSK